ncbi:MAG: iron chelate uptake ABC transporter family permease subunit, partial [Candidatus Hydrogenedentota bacterium]
PIGFVGLIIPHAMRMLFGPDHRLLFPLAFLGGGIFLMASDTIARVGVRGSEIPVGVITALCGGPLFIFLLRRQIKKTG